MQQVSAGFLAAASAEISNPQHGFFVSWLRQSASGGYFTIGVSHIGGSDVIKGSGNNPAESNTYLYVDESSYVISLEIDRQLMEPVYSVSQALADIVLDNTSDRFTPGFDPTIGTSIVTQRPLKITSGYLVSNSPQVVQLFTGQISQIPTVDTLNKQVTLNAIDYSQVVQNVSLATATLQQNQTSGQIIAFLFQLAGLAATQYIVDPGTITIPYAFFAANQTIGDIATQIAECEGASLYCDENGIFHYDTRNIWLDAPRTNRKHARIDMTAFTSGYKYWQPPQAPVAASTTYWCSLRYRSNVSVTLMAEVDNGTTKTTTTLATLAAASSWTTVSYSSATLSDTIKMRFYLAIAAVGWVETDDYILSLVQGSTVGSLIPNFSTELGTYGANLITNGDFETDVSGWTTYKTGSDPLPTLTQSNAEFYTGLYAAKLVTTTVTGEQGMTQTLSGLTSGDQYNVMLAVFGNAGGETAKVTLGSTTQTVNLVKGWQYLYFTILASGTTAVVKVGTTTANATIFVDSILVVHGTGGTPTNWGTITSGTNTATYFWVNRGQSDIALLLTDYITKDDEQYNPSQNTIINSVTVTANPRKPVSSAVVMFSLSSNDSRLVPAGSTASVLCSYVDTNNVPLPFISLTIPTATGTDSFWTANSAADGSGSNQTSNLTLTSFTNYSTSSEALFTNATGSDIYLTGLQIKGISVPITQQIVVTVTDATSILNYGEQVYPINNDFIQSYDQAQTIAQNLVNDWKDQANYRVFTILGQPQLQLGDRIRRNGVDYFILRIMQTQDATSGLIQEIWAVNRPSYP